MIRNERGWLLLEKRSDCGLWGLPGGRIEPGESVKEATIREVREETGLLVGIHGLIGIYSDPYAGRILAYPEAVVHSIDIGLEASILGGKLRASSESETVQFFDPNALPSDLVASSKALLADVLCNVTGQVR